MNKTQRPATTKKVNKQTRDRLTALSEKLLTTYSQEERITINTLLENLEEPHHYDFAFFQQTTEVRHWEELLHTHSLQPTSAAYALLTIEYRTRQRP